MTPILNEFIAKHRAARARIEAAAAPQKSVLCIVERDRRELKRLPPPPDPMEGWVNFHVAMWSRGDGPDTSTLGVINIRNAVAAHFKMTIEEMMSERRTARVVYARHIAFYLARELTTRSLPAIGRCFGGRDHTTVLHGARKIALRIKTDVDLAATVSALRADLS